MTQENDQIRAKIKFRNKAKIIHAKFILIVFAILCAIEIFYLVDTYFNSFIPKSYSIPGILTNLLFISPSLLSFKYPKIAFLIAGFFCAILIFACLFSGSFYLLLFYGYILAAMFLGYKAVEVKEKEEYIPNGNEDILDSDLF